MLDNFKNSSIIANVPDAGVAHPVERHLAKVEVASSSLVTRSIIKTDFTGSRSYFFVKSPPRLEPYNTTVLRTVV